MNTVEEFLERSLEQIDGLVMEVFSKEQVKKMITNILTSLNYMLKQSYEIK